MSFAQRGRGTPRFCQQYEVMLMVKSDKLPDELSVNVA